MSVISRAEAAGREYITPEDVQDAIDAGEPIADIRLDVLGVIGKALGMGAEDASLCAFLAWNNQPTTDEERAEVAG